MAWVAISLALARRLFGAKKTVDQPSYTCQVRGVKRASGAWYHFLHYGNKVFERASFSWRFSAFRSNILPIHTDFKVLR